MQQRVQGRCRHGASACREASAAVWHPQHHHTTRDGFADHVPFLGCVRPDRACSGRGAPGGEAPGATWTAGALHAATGGTLGPSGYAVDLCGDVVAGVHVALASCQGPHLPVVTTRLQCRSDHPHTQHMRTSCQGPHATVLQRRVTPPTQHMCTLRVLHHASRRALAGWRPTCQCRLWTRPSAWRATSSSTARAMRTCSTSSTRVAARAPTTPSSCG
jgi:hypothetical protein